LTNEEYDAKVLALQLEIEKLHTAADLDRCECCGRAPDKAADGRSLARLQGRLAYMRSERCASALDADGARAFAELSNKFLTNERQFARSWANDKIFELEELALAQADDVEEFEDLRGKHWARKKQAAQLEVVED
jgi:hypothetical protein